MRYLNQHLANLVGSKVYVTIVENGVMSGELTRVEADYIIVTRQANSPEGKVARPYIVRTAMITTVQEIQK
jgi:ferredoxin-fold anticodon binding domain-containing protein